MPTIDATHTTLLRIDDIELPPYATRSIEMSVEPIAQASQTRRDVNGTLYDLSLHQFRKVRATISGKDFESPIFTGVWPGRIVDVTFVPETGWSEDSTGDTSGDVVKTMMVISLNSSRAEQEGETSWEISLEEV